MEIEKAFIISLQTAHMMVKSSPLRNIVMAPFTLETPKINHSFAYVKAGHKKLGI